MSRSLVYGSAIPLSEIEPRPNIARSAAAAIGRLGSPKSKFDVDRAVKFGRRRLAVVAGVLAAGLLVAGSVDIANESNQAAHTYQEKVEACAGTLVGYTVHLSEDPKTGMQLIPGHIFREVQACQSVQGDIARAAVRLG